MNDNKYHKILRVNDRKLGTMNQTKEPADFASLYRRAFAEYGTQALWNKRVRESPKAR